MSSPEGAGKGCLVFSNVSLELVLYGVWCYEVLSNVFFTVWWSVVGCVSS